jgi:hypothetical protein
MSKWTKSLCFFNIRPIFEEISHSKSESLLQLKFKNRIFSFLRRPVITTFAMIVEFKQLLKFRTSSLQL